MHSNKRSAIALDAFNVSSPSNVYFCHVKASITVTMIYYKNAIFYRGECFTSQPNTLATGTYTPHNLNKQGKACGIEWVRVKQPIHTTVLKRNGYNTLLRDYLRSVFRRLPPNLCFSICLGKGTRPASWWNPAELQLPSAAACIHTSAKNAFLPHNTMADDRLLSNIWRYT